MKMELLYVKKGKVKVLEVDKIEFWNERTLKKTEGHFEATESKAGKIKVREHGIVFLKFMEKYPIHPIIRRKPKPEVK